MIVKLPALDISHLSLSSAKIVFFSTLFAFFLIFTTQSFAESTSVYGPIKSGETLWKISKKSLPSNSVSIEQIAYAIYLSNPKAFQSGNINSLIKGVQLTIPSIENISKITNDEARQQIDRLQVAASKLSIVKANSKKFRKQIKKHQKQLKRYRRNTRAWKKTVRRLARSKRNLAVSKREIARVSTLFQKRVKLKTVNRTRKEVSPLDDSQKTNSTIERNISAAVLTVPTPNSQVQNTELSTREGRLSATQAAPSLVSRIAAVDWLELIKKNLILIGASINGLILLVVLFKLFERKEKEEVDFV